MHMMLSNFLPVFIHKGEVIPGGKPIFHYPIIILGFITAFR